MKGTTVPGNHFADFDQDSPRSLGINTGRGGNENGGGETELYGLR
jgi:hypothetical protein